MKKLQKYDLKKRKKKYWRSWKISWKVMNRKYEKNVFDEEGLENDEENDEVWRKGWTNPDEGGERSWLRMEWKVDEEFGGGQSNKGIYIWKSFAKWENIKKEEERPDIALISKRKLPYSTSDSGYTTMKNQLRTY